VKNDDTPYIPLPCVEVGDGVSILAKSALGSMFPRLPGYKSNWLPGCLIETIVNANALLNIPFNFGGLRHLQKILGVHVIPSIMICI
jgi:hypothetical protein